MMRLQKYLALCGVASRRNAEKMIAEGRVAVNGQVSSEMGQQVDENADTVTVDGKTVHMEAEKHYLAYNKPIGEVTTVSDPEGRPTVLDKFRDYPVRLFPVGRLDFDSEGLLILTNDGEMMQALLHPSNEVPKLYLTRVIGEVPDEALRRLKNGVMVDNRLTSPAHVRLVSRNEIYTSLVITIHEGRNRQVRRMLEAVGYKVAALKRVGFGPIELGDLPRGMWRHLTQAEIARLRKLMARNG